MAQHFKLLVVPAEYTQLPVTKSRNPTCVSRPGTSFLCHMLPGVLMSSVDNLKLRLTTPTFFACAGQEPHPLPTLEI